MSLSRFQEIGFALVEMYGSQEDIEVVVGPRTFMRLWSDAMAMSYGNNNYGHIALYAPNGKITIKLRPEAERTHP